MTALLYLIPAALALGLLGLVAFLWAMRTDQFGDLDGAAERILYDDDSLPAPNTADLGGARPVAGARHRAHGRPGPSLPLSARLRHRRRRRRTRAR